MSCCFPYPAGAARASNALAGRRALVTGSSAGIGEAVALELHRLGADVVVSGRDRGRCEKAVEGIRASSTGSGTLEVLPMDLANFGSVRQAAAALQGPLQLLVLNAGMVYYEGYAGPWLNDDGIDQLFASNHLGHFLLTELLLPRLEMGSPSRILVTSSIGQYFALADELIPQKGVSLESLASGQRDELFRRSYGASKLANVLHAYELQRRLGSRGSGVAVVPLAPGLVATGIERRSVPRAGAVTPAVGAASTIHAALLEPAPETGRWCIPYWMPPLSCLRLLPRSALLKLQIKLEVNQKLTWGMRTARSCPLSYDEELARRLWDYSAEAVGLHEEPAASG